jgi:hypothetical protein
VRTLSVAFIILVLRPLNLLEKLDWSSSIRNHAALCNEEHLHGMICVFRAYMVFIIKTESVYCAVRTASLNIIQVHLVFKVLTCWSRLKLESSLLCVKYSTFCRSKSCFSYWYKMCLSLVQPLHHVCHNYTVLHLAPRKANPASITFLLLVLQLQNMSSLSRFQHEELNRKPYLVLFECIAKGEKMMPRYFHLTPVFIRPMYKIWDTSSTHAEHCRNPLHSTSFQQSIILVSQF